MVLMQKHLSILREGGKKQEGLSPDAVTFVCSLKACGCIGAIAQGIELHNDIEKAGLLRNVSLGTTLIEMYAKCGSLEKVQAVFNQLPSKDVIMWNALMSSLWNNQEALMCCCEAMQHEGVHPNVVSCAFPLLFESLQRRDLGSYKTLICGYAQLRESTKTVNFFKTE